jgi:hypothetical protein
MDEPASQNVLAAGRYGCRMITSDSNRCGKQVINVQNAIVCEHCFQTLYQNLMYKLDRPWCLNHGKGCLSERICYVPLPGIQSYTIPGRPGGAFKASGAFMMGHHCAACSLQNVTLSQDSAIMHDTVRQYDDEETEKSRKRSRSDEMLDTLRGLPAKTEEQMVLIDQMTQFQERLSVRQKKLKADQTALEDTIRTLITIVVPTN